MSVSFFNQAVQITENALTIFQYNFGEKYSTQYALIAMIKTAKKSSIKLEHLESFKQLHQKYFTLCLV